jgi:hypothetical protein
MKQMLLAVLFIVGCGRRFVDNVPTFDAASAPDAMVEVPWCQQAADTVYVHAALGANGNDGSCANPLKSIVQALAKGSKIVQIGGGTVGTPLVYSQLTTQESFPLVLDQSVDLRGAGKELVTIGGGGQVVNQGVYAVQVTGIGVSISGVNIRGLKGGGLDGGGVLVSDNAQLTMTASSIREAGGDGLVATAFTRVTVDNSLIADNRNNISGDCKMLTLSNSIIQGAPDAGVFLYAQAELTSTNNHFLNNIGAGVSLTRESKMHSSNDTFEGSAIGLGANSPNTYIKFDVTGATFKNNTVGLELNDKPDLILRSSRFIGNQKGLQVVSSIDSGFNIDLGTTEGSPNLGDNVFQSKIPAEKNTLAGICNESSRPITARGNSFSACPTTPAVAATCAAAADVAGRGAILATCKL